MKSGEVNKSFSSKEKFGGKLIIGIESQEQIIIH
jgi:hypothetical protein